MMTNNCCKRSIDDLNDEMLREILFRLPYAIAVSCKIVSKRWCSLISDPLFVVHGSLINRKINQCEPTWILLLTMKAQNYCSENTIVMFTPSACERIVRPHILSFEYLPSSSRVVASFRDLALCFGAGKFYLCNLLTKQWTTILPSQRHRLPLLWVGFVCQEGHGIRVVVVHSIPLERDIRGAFVFLNLDIYLSEIGRWKNVNLRIPTHANNKGDSRVRFTGVVCNRMVCLRHHCYFGAFNPFDVTPSFDGTLTGMQLPYIDGMLVECGGKIVAVDHYLYIRSSSEDNAIVVNTLGWHTWKLDLRLDNHEQPLRRELISRLDGSVKVKESTIIIHNSDDRHMFKVVGVHPSKEHLVCLITCDPKIPSQLVLCDTRSKTLEPLSTTFHPRLFVASNKLDIPSWPTQIPDL